MIAGSDSEFDCMEQVELRARRELRTLPKAHLHLHLSGAVVRRETLEDFAAMPGWEKQREVALAEANVQIASSLAKDQPKRAEKYRR